MLSKIRISLSTWKYKGVCLIEPCKVDGEGLTCLSLPFCTCWEEWHSLGIQPYVAGSIFSAPCRNPSSWQIPQKEQHFKAQQRHLVQQKMVTKSSTDPLPSPPQAISTPLLRQSLRNFCPCSTAGFCWHSPAQQPVGQTRSTAAYAMLVFIMRSLLPRAHVLCKAGKKVMSVAGRNIMPCYSS